MMFLLLVSTCTRNKVVLRGHLSCLIQHIWIFRQFLYFIVVNLPKLVFRSCYNTVIIECKKLSHLFNNHIFLLSYVSVNHWSERFLHYKSLLRVILIWGVPSGHFSSFFTVFGPSENFF